MSQDQSRRKALREQFDQSRPEAGVYRIVNTRTNRALLGSATNLAAVRNRLEFARSTGSFGALDHRLVPDARSYGIDAFTLDVLEVLTPRPEMTPAALRADLEVLEDLWREKLDPALLY